MPCGYGPPRRDLPGSPIRTPSSAASTRFRRERRSRSCLRCCTSIQAFGARTARTRNGSTRTTRRLTERRACLRTRTSRSELVSACASGVNSLFRKPCWCSEWCCSAFELIDHLHSELTIKTSLTVKSDVLLIRVRPRMDRHLDDPTAVPSALKPAQDVRAATAPKASTGPMHGTPLAVPYGSNLGTAE